MELIKSMLSGVDHLYNTVILFGALFITLFFGLSHKKGLKIFTIILTAFSLISAFAATIYSYETGGAFTSVLFNMEIREVIEICIILFIALNILIFISLNNINKNQFIKIIIIFLFSVCSLVMMLLAGNFIMIFVSFTAFITGVFQLLSALNSMDLRSYMIRFFLVSTFAISILLISFSFLYGTTDFKNFNQIFETADLMANPLLAIGILLFGACIFIYLFIFPFQGPYLKLIRRCEQSSMLVIWFLYFPAGLFMFLKINDILFYFIGKNNVYMTPVFIFIAFICILFGNIGAIRTHSIRRMLAFIFLSFLGISILSYAMVGTGLVDKDRAEWLFMANIILLVLSYFPVYSIITAVEKGKTDSGDNDSLENLRGVVRINKYIGINFIIILLSFIGMIGTTGFLNRYFYIQPFFKLASSISNETAISANTVSAILIGIAVMVATIFLAANILRLMVISLSKPKTMRDAGADFSDGGSINQRIDNEITGSIRYSRFHYVYITAFSLIIITVGIIGLLEILNIGPELNLNITGF